MNAVALGITAACGSEFWLVKIPQMCLVYPCVMSKGAPEIFPSTFRFKQVVYVSLGSRGCKKSMAS
jgi:hypothetical protein